MPDRYEQMVRALRSGVLRTAATSPAMLDPATQMPAAPPQPMPMDPAMMGAPAAAPAMPPMDPAMAGMAPPMAPPMDPSMMGAPAAMPPMDPAMAGGMPPVPPGAEGTIDPSVLASIGQMPEAEDPMADPSETEELKTLIGDVQKTQKEILDRLGELEKQVTDEKELSELLKEAEADTQHQAGSDKDFQSFMSGMIGKTRAAFDKLRSK